MWEALFSRAVLSTILYYSWIGVAIGKCGLCGLWRGLVCMPSTLSVDIWTERCRNRDTSVYFYHWVCLLTWNRKGEMRKVFNPIGSCPNRHRCVATFRLL
ncbi:hypothetical protein BKA61DRAFT_9459 [Leptodontidium sp. MPI-SDFR-AT-0119]|nr:hypothetical protein BKA61DRAFT_9459 [Leptodontidium sp. MPI-SDFR-AT-0119]